jgi:hypothetical protein
VKADTILWEISPVSSRSKSEPSQKPAEAGGEPVKAITTNIHVNRKARRLDWNVGEYAVVGSVTAGGENWEGRVGINTWDFIPWPQCPSAVHDHAIAYEHLSEPSVNKFEDVNLRGNFGLHRNHTDYTTSYFRTVGSINVKLLSFQSE